ncbi:NuA4-domain-containing protein [Suillus subaureus]|jgi:chromatin modification-related protein EAF6|uniref:Chromatin modification-related protein EAF6 n=1 Tax=Suillus subaureus TaxID=48587 RepID=A0A9P7EJK3_9AGAM|nr:NuA4-domain-containing protein [Suillus subaureus]KAG1822806.1 NuA4-domain-containing protein [Suillus subaureus]KAG2134326.1 histone acetyltransferase subunit NuA4-domain-containing protein [Suillus cothurnatus]
MASKDPPTAEEKARYEKVKDELVKMIQKKRAADRQLAQTEVLIHTLETSYLAETSTTGNIIHGFDGYLKPTQGAAARRKHDIGDGDRWFSTSSGTWQKSLDLLGEGEDSTPAPDDMRLQTTPGLTTVVVPPAPRTQELTAAQQKKNRDREYQRRKRAMRRSAGTVSDEDSQSIGTGRRPTKRARIADDD